MSKVVEKRQGTEDNFTIKRRNYFTIRRKNRSSRHLETGTSCSNGKGRRKGCGMQPSTGLAVFNVVQQIVQDYQQKNDGKDYLYFGSVGGRGDSPHFINVYGVYVSRGE
jgi:hypothetical protein